MAHERILLGCECNTCRTTIEFLKEYDQGKVPENVLQEMRVHYRDLHSKSFDESSHKEQFSYIHGAVRAAITEALVAAKLQSMLNEN